MVEERPLYRHERHLRSFQFFRSVLIVLWSIQLAIFSFDSPFVFYNYSQLCARCNRPRMDLEVLAHIQKVDFSVNL